MRPSRSAVPGFLQVRWRASADPDRAGREEGASPVIDFLKFWARACIAVSGGTDTPPAQGSRPTYPVGVLGGVDACVGRFGPAPPCRLILPSARQSRASRFLMRSGGCQDHWPSCGRRQAVIGTRSRETPSEADRMGCRFKGGRQLELVPREWPYSAGFQFREHYRRVLPLRIDTGAQRRRTHRVAPRCGLRPRLLHAGRSRFCRHGPHWPASAKHADKIRNGGDGCRALGTKGQVGHA